MKIDVLNPDLYLDGLPHEQFRYLRDQEPCFFYRLDDPQLLDDAWVLSRYDDVRSAERDPARFISAKGVTMSRRQADKANMMMLMDGADHSRNRGVISSGFTPRVVKTFEQHFRELARGIVEGAIAKGTFDFVADVAVELPMHAIFDLLGVPHQDRYQLLGWANMVVSPTDPDMAPTPEASFEAALALHEYGLKLADQKRHNPSEDDVMSEIVRAVDGEFLTDDELMGFTFLLIGAGTETTRNAIAHGLHALMQHPEQLEWLRNHLDPLPNSAVEEILRYGSPGIYMRRTAAKDIELHGKVIKEGARIVLLYPAANYDPAEFPDPHVFDLTRTPNQHMTFGSGPHFCLGAHVARLELHIIFEEFLARIRGLRPAGPIEYARSSLVRGVKHLPVTVDAA